MKFLFALFALVYSALAQLPVAVTKQVSTDTNGVLVGSRTNFFATNTATLWPAIAPPIAASSAALSNALVAAVGGTNAILGTQITNNNATLASHTATLATKWTQPFQATSSGLTLSISAGTWYTVDGIGQGYAGGAITVPASQVSYIYLDYFSGQLMPLFRAWHTGGLLLATVTANGSAITAISQPVSFFAKANPLQPYLDKVYEGAATRVLILADSLSNGNGLTNGNNSWPNLIFNNVGWSSQWQLPNTANITIDRRGIMPGATAKWGMFALSTLAPQSAANGTDFRDQALEYGAYSLTTGGAGVDIGDNTARQRAPDLVIIAFGANLETYSEEYVENVLRYFRNAGSCVLVLTDNDQSTHSAAPLIDGTTTFLPDLCSRYRGGLGDTYALVKLVNQQGTNSYFDTIHQTESGQAYGWAVAVRGCLNDKKLGYPGVTQDWGPRLAVPTDSANRKLRFPNAAKIDLIPMSTTGTQVSAATSQSPAVQLARVSSGSAVYWVHSGQYIIYRAGIMPLEISAIVSSAPGTNATLSLTEANGATTIKSGIAVTGNSNPAQLVTLLSYSDIESFTSSYNTYTFPSQAPVAFKLNVTAGDLYIEGLLVQTLATTQASWSDITDLSASASQSQWPLESSALGGAFMRWMYSDTSSERLAFNFTGNGCIVPLYAGVAGGQVEIIVDGVVYASTLDLYNSVSLAGLGTVYYYTIWPGWTSGLPTWSNYARHSVRIRYLGSNNGSAVATSANQGRRLALYGPPFSVDAR